MKTFTNATAKEIENGVISYTFNSEAETEAAVIECIEKGIRFNTTGRRSLVIYQPAPAAETYAVCWGVDYTEEEGESNAIAETRDEADAKKFAENESKDNKCRMCVVRKSDGKVIAIYDNTNNTPDTTTPSTSDTMNNETKTINEEKATAIYNRVESMAARGGRCKTSN